MPPCSWASQNSRPLEGNTGFVSLEVPSMALQEQGMAVGRSCLCYCSCSDVKIKIIFLASMTVHGVFTVWVVFKNRW